MYCEKCGAPAKANFCTQCGNPVPLTFPKDEKENPNYTVNKNYKGDIPPFYEQQDSNSNQTDTKNQTYNNPNVNPNYTQTPPTGGYKTTQPPYQAPYANQNPFKTKSWQDYNYGYKPNNDQNTNYGQTTESQQNSNNGYNSSPGQDPNFNNNYNSGSSCQYNDPFCQQAPYNQAPYGGFAPPKEKLIALLLCIFLGYLGIHRFYVGKVGSGILYLCTGGLFGIGYIIDIIMIVTDTFRDQYNRPLI